jgi:hypothetical protein
MITPEIVDKRRKNGDNVSLFIIIAISVLIGAIGIYFLLIYRHVLMKPTCVDYWCSKLWFGE